MVIIWLSWLPLCQVEDSMKFSWKPFAIFVTTAIILLVLATFCNEGSVDYAYAQQPDYGTPKATGYVPQGNRKYLIDTLWISLDDTFRSVPNGIVDSSIVVVNNNNFITIDTTTVISTQYYVDSSITVNNTTIINTISDSSQYYYYLSKNEYHFPPFKNLVPWDSMEVAEDSVDICVWVDSTSGSWRTYHQIQAKSTTSTEQHIFLVMEFVAPRAAPDVGDTLFDVEYTTSSTDTDSSAIKLMVHEGSTRDYIDAALTASTSWTNKIILGDSLDNVASGDRFKLIIRADVTYGATTNPYVRISKIEERWED